MAILEQTSEQMQLQRVDLAKEKYQMLEGNYESVKNAYWHKRIFLKYMAIVLFVVEIVVPIVLSILLQYAGNNIVMNVILQEIAYLMRWIRGIALFSAALYLYRTLTVTDPMTLKRMRFFRFEEHYLNLIASAKQELYKEETLLAELHAESVAFQERDLTAEERTQIVSDEMFKGDMNDISENENGDEYISLEDALEDLKAYDEEKQTL